MKLQAVLDRPWLVHLCRLLLAFVFIGASIGKILDVTEFMKALSAYRLLPAVLVAPFGHFLPWVEFTIGICLLIDRWPKGAALLTSLMLAFFIVIILITMARGLEIECGCFTFLKDDSLMKTVVRDLILLVPALFLLRKRGARTP